MISETYIEEVNLKQQKSKKTVKITARQISLIALDLEAMTELTHAIKNA